MAVADRQKNNCSGFSSRLGSKGQLNSALISRTPLSAWLCENSSGAVVDVMILLLVLAACGLLFYPYVKYLFTEAALILPLYLIFIGELICGAPLAYVMVVILLCVVTVGIIEFQEYKSRKCTNPKCKGLRKCAKYDIQIEYEGSRSSEDDSQTDLRTNELGVELGHKHKQLEAKLKKMAPPNGRAVLVFRYRCGCPAAHIAVSGSKKPQKILRTVKCK